MKKLTKVLLIVLVLSLCAMSFMACSLEYGTPDKLDMANSSVGQRIVIGLEVAAMGVGVVFLVLALLIGFIVLFKYSFKGMDTLKAKFKKQPKVEAPKAAAPAKIEGLDNVDDEIAAVISAAIMAYYDNTNVRPEYKSNLTFKVRKIKEIK